MTCAWVVFFSVSCGEEAVFLCCHQRHSIASRNSPSATKPLRKMCLTHSALLPYLPVMTLI